MYTGYSEDLNSLRGTQIHEKYEFNGKCCMKLRQISKFVSDGKKRFFLLYQGLKHVLVLARQALTPL